MDRADPPATAAQDQAQSTTRTMFPGTNALEHTLTCLADGLQRRSTLPRSGPRAAVSKPTAAMTYPPRMGPSASPHAHAALKT